MVSDSGGFDDKSFNQTSYKGMTDAKAELGIETGQVESQTAADLRRTFSRWWMRDCNIIVTVGFLLSDDTLAAAKKNPDASSPLSITMTRRPTRLSPTSSRWSSIRHSRASCRVPGRWHDEDQEARHLRRRQDPDGHDLHGRLQPRRGLLQQAEERGCEVLGWDAAKQDGQFTGDFEDIKGGQRTAQGLISQGADIVFPVAGPAGLGALQAAKASGGKVNAIWVDTDGCVSAETYCPNIITSVNKAWMWRWQTRSRPRRMAHSPTSYVGTWRTMAPA